VRLLDEREIERREKRKGLEMGEQPSQQIMP